MFANYMKLYVLCEDTCNPKYKQKYAMTNLQKYSEICKKNAKICIDPSNIDIKQKYAKTY